MCIRRSALRIKLKNIERLAFYINKKLPVYEYQKPPYLFMTSRKVITKDNKGNSNLNFSALKMNVHNDGISFIRGVTSSKSVRSEIGTLFDKMMKHLEKEDSPYQFF